MDRNDDSGREAVAPGRILSLDVLRGFTMFWILGADVAVLALAQWIDVGPVRFLAHQVDHAPWAGCRFYDLIFPTFIFVTGASLVFSLEKAVSRSSRREIVRRVLLRAAVLFLLGVIYNGGLSSPWPDVRLAGVLQRIAIAYACAAVLYLFVSARMRVVVAAGLLLAYWGILALVPIRDIALDRASIASRLGSDTPPWDDVQALYSATTATVRGRFEPGLNVANHLDFLALPGAKYDTYWDPEGLLSTLPAIATCLLGVMVGCWLRRVDTTDRGKILRLALAGVLCLALGWLWHLQFPVIKKIWTSSFVLVSAGWSMLFLAAFAWIVDVRRWRGWCQPFVWIGMNPITLYLATALVDFGRIASFFVGGSVALGLDTTLGNGAAACVNALLALVLIVALARFLHRRGIYLRV